VYGATEILVGMREAYLENKNSIGERSPVIHPRRVVTSVNSGNTAPVDERMLTIWPAVADAEYTEVGAVPTRASDVASDQAAHYVGISSAVGPDC